MKTILKTDPWEQSCSESSDKCGAWNEGTDANPLTQRGMEPPGRAYS